MANDTDILIGTVKAQPTKQADGGITFPLAREGDGKLFDCHSLTGSKIERSPGEGERVALHGRESAGMFTRVDGIEVPGAPPVFGFVKLEVRSSWKGKVVKKSMRSFEELGVRHGFIGFFDILGYKSITQNNPIAEMISVVKKIRETIETQQGRLNATEEFIGAKFCDHLVFSDSILVFTPLPERGREHLPAAVFAEFCAGLINDLFWAGLPIRGALAFGDYYVDIQPGKLCFAGLPIIEAWEWSNRIDLAGCVVAPSAETALTETQIIDSSDRPLGFIRHSVPLKAQEKKKMLMLDHPAFDRHYRNNPEMSRQLIEEKFSAYNKHVTGEVLPKINNTLEFWELSRTIPT